MPEKKRIGIFSFSGCSGEQLVILECREQLLELFKVSDVVGFPMAQSKNEHHHLDIALLEGSITTETQRNELEYLRRNSEILVAMGTCACYGGIQSMKNNDGKWKDRFQKVYGENEKLVSGMKPTESKACDHYVKIDYYLPGCPIDKDQFLHSISHLLNNCSPHLYPFPVCTECKWKENDCLLNRDELCLGPLTRGGCGAICPSHNLTCVGCWGPAEVINVPSEMKLLLDKGYDLETITRNFRKFGGKPMIDKLKKIMENIK